MRDVIAAKFDLIRTYAPLEFLGQLARQLLFSLLLADALVLYGALLDVRHEGGHYRPATNLVSHIGIQTVAAHPGENRTDHESPAAPNHPPRSRVVFLGFCPKLRPTHSSPPLMLGCWSVNDVVCNYVNAPSALNSTSVCI